MKTKWYGDQRDIVKWSVLLHLAKAHGLRTIVHICFLNQYDFPPICVDGEEFQVPGEVIQHFRTISSVRNISKDLTVAVFDQPFDNRDSYLSSALKFAAQYDGSPKAVFLDPDTGLAPRKADSTHVSESEVSHFWSNLFPGDFFVLYQHQTNRNGRPWREEKQRQLAKAIKVDFSQVRIANSRAIASDVVFFFVRKS